MPVTTVYLLPSVGSGEEGEGGRGGEGGGKASSVNSTTTGPPSKNTGISVQWNLRIMDTLGTRILSIVQRLSLLWR